jgi:hypothetical protein
MQRSLFQRSFYCLLVLCTGTGCGDQATSYFPLDDGRYWQYRIHRTTMDGSVTQKYLIETLPSRELNGAKVNAKQTIDGHQYFYHADTTGVRRVAQKLRTDAEILLNTPHDIVLPADPIIGANWQQVSQTSVLESAHAPWESLYRLAQPVTLDYVVESTSETVHVSAGTFDDCLRVVGHGKVAVEIGNYIGRAEIAVTVTEWYAPGVGLVRSERSETTDAAALKHGALVMELESYR